MIKKIILSIDLIQGFCFGGSKYVIKFEDYLLEALRFIFILKKRFFGEVQKTKNIFDGKFGVHEGF